jgi:uncharacterized protein YcfJ
MKLVIKSIFLILLASFVAACDPYHQDEQVGTATGAVAGGLLGSLIGGGTGKVIAVGVGAVGGALVGNSIGRSMDEERNSGNSN